ncbi:hypothetical protein [Photobacterium indicum]|uniref:hypothetical protein n=1 Tax=Photobacterium indicum TaxID=81447 RepID=UPI003D10F881
MKAGWKRNKNLKPKVILDKIDSLKTITDGKISFSSFEFMEAVVALENMINFPQVAHDLNTSSIISDAVWELAKNEKIECGLFISQVNLNIKKSLAKRDNQYYLLTSISMSDIGIRSIKLNDCIIRFYKSDFPRKFKGRKSLVDSKVNKKPTESNGYIKVVVELKAKSELIAVNESLRTLDLLRGMFNFFANGVSEYIGTEWEPINKVRLGEFHTIHNNFGDVYSDVFWYDPSYSQAIAFKSKNTIAIVKNVKWMITNLNKINRQYKVILTEGILRYVRAFDERNQNVAVMRAWSALECVAAPNETNCDAVTKRCAFLFEEYEYNKQILEYLREYRNRNVHAGEESDKAKDHGFQIQKYFKKLVLFHIANTGYFSDIAEANRFLDLSDNESSLRNARKIIERALKFRGYTA